MAKFELKLPKMGESVAEATVTNWLKNVGDTIEADEPVLEIATDKVDSEVPSEVDGVLVEILFNTDDVVQVGQTMAIIETNSDAAVEAVQSTAQETESVKAGGCNSYCSKRYYSCGSCCIKYTRQILLSTGQENGPKRKYFTSRIRHHTRNWKGWSCF